MRIYLVEEENIVRGIIRNFLTDIGHEAIVLNALGELSDALIRNPHPADLIIVDLPTPRREAITRGMTEVHTRHPEIPFVVRVSSALLSPYEAVRCGVYAYLHKPIRLAELELMLIRLSETRTATSLQDERTGLYQRIGFLALAQQQLKVAHRTKTELSFLLAGLNGTTSGDGGGHTENGRALVALAGIVKETFRESDILGRLNGKDCGLLLVDTSEEGATIAVSRLHEHIEAHARAHPSRSLSVNVGVSHYDPEAPCALDELVSRADKAT